MLKSGFHVVRCGVVQAMSGHEPALAEESVQHFEQAVKLAVRVAAKNMKQQTADQDCPAHSRLWDVNDVSYSKE